ncbi:MAG: type IV secretion system protein [Novosphingobium sp.]
MKKALFLAAVMTICVPATAGAQGIAVYDNSSTLQLISQVKNTLQQIQQGEQMINQATQTYQSFAKLTNTANFANILNNANVNQLLPSGVTDVVTLARSDYSALGNFGSAAQGLSNGYSIQTNLGQGGTLDGTVSSAYGRFLQSINQGPSVAATLGYNVSNQAKQVDAGLDELRQDISTAQDPKDSMDLAARATIENAKINNRLLQLMGMQQYYNANERMRYNAYRLSNTAARMSAIDTKLQTSSTQWTGY